MPIHRSKPPNGEDQMKKTLVKTLSRTFDAIAVRQARADRLRAERDAMIMARRKSNTLEGTLEAIWNTLNGPNGGAFVDRDTEPAGDLLPIRTPPAPRVASALGNAELKIGRKHRRISKALALVQQVYEGYADGAGRRSLIQTASNLKLILS